jgi:hypothetical protein
LADPPCYAETKNMMQNRTKPQKAPRGQPGRRSPALPHQQRNCRSKHQTRNIHPTHEAVRTFAFSAPLRWDTPTPRPDGLDLFQIYIEPCHALPKLTLRELRTLCGENQVPALSLSVPQGSTRSKQAVTRSDKATQASRKNTPASLACKPSLPKCRNRAGEFLETADKSVPHQAPLKVGDGLMTNRTPSHFRKLKVAKGYSRLGKVTGNPAPLKVEPRFNLESPWPSPCVAAEIVRRALASSLEPVVGIEPTTYGLRNRCSTTELHWPQKKTPWPIALATPRFIIRCLARVKRLLFPSVDQPNSLCHQKISRRRTSTRNGTFWDVSVSLPPLSQNNEQILVTNPLNFPTKINQCGAPQVCNLNSVFS